MTILGEELKQLPPMPQAPEDDEDMQTQITRFYLENLQRLGAMQLPQVAPPSRKEKVLGALGFDVSRAEAGRQQPLKQAMLEHQFAIQNLGALEPLLRAQLMTPYQQGQLGLGQNRLDEATQYHQQLIDTRLAALEGKQNAPSNLQMHDTSKGPMWFDPKNPKEPGIPVTGQGGEPIGPKIPSNLAGIQQQLDNADRVLAEMETNYMQGPRGALSGLRRGVGTASANIFGGETGGKLGLSGMASAVDPHAVIHERDRNAMATILAFPLTGSRRSMEGARQSLMNVIPHYSDPPNVWAVFSRQARDLINTARRMPWGEDPETSSENYGAHIDAAIANLTAMSGGTETPPPKAPNPVDDFFNKHFPKR